MVLPTMFSVGFLFKVVNSLDCIVKVLMADYKNYVVTELTLTLQHNYNYVMACFVSWRCI